MLILLVLYIFTTYLLPDYSTVLSIHLSFLHHRLMTTLFVRIDHVTSTRLKCKNSNVSSFDDNETNSDDDEYQ